MARLYTAIIFTGDPNIGQEGYVKWRRVGNLSRLKSNALARYPDLKFINIYDKKTKELWECWKPNSI